MPKHHDINIAISQMVLLMTMTITLRDTACALSYEACVGATTVPINSRLHLDRADKGGSRCFTTRIEVPGTWLIEVSLPGEIEGDSEFLVFDGSCEPPGDASDGVVTLERLAGVVLGVREAGDYIFCIATEEAGLGAAELYVRSVLLHDILLKGGDPDEIEPDPDPEP